MSHAWEQIPRSDGDVVASSTDSVEQSDQAETLFGKPDGTIVISDGKTTESIRVSRHPVGSLLLSPKGNYIVAAVFPEGEEKYRILWDRGAGKVVEQFPGSPLYHSRQAISPDEFVLAYSADDYSIVLWNIPQRRETSVLNGHTWHLYGLEFAPVSRLLASFDWDGFCRLWDVGEGKPADPHILRGHLSGISYAAFSADGRTIATRADDDSARFWSVATGQELLSQRSEPLSHPLISPQGDRLVGLTAEGGERNIRVVTLPSLSEIDAMISRENRQ